MLVRLPKCECGGQFTFDLKVTKEKIPLRKKIFSGIIREITFSPILRCEKCGTEVKPEWN